MSGQQTLNVGVTAATVGTASGQCIGINLTRAALFFQNVHASASIAICPVSFGAAALNTAGSLMLLAGQGFIIDGERSVDAFNAIASGAGTPLTIWEL